MSVGRFLQQAAAGNVDNTRTYVAIPHNNDASNNNLSLYEIDNDELVLLDQIRCRASNSAVYAYQVAFNPNPNTYGKIMAVSTNAGTAIIDYSNDTLTEVGTAGGYSEAARGVAYSSDGSKLFTSGNSSGYFYRYDQATNGTTSNETQSSYIGISEYINAISIAKTKDVGIVAINKGSSAAIGVHTFTPSDFSLDSSFVTTSQELLAVDISEDGTFAVYVGKESGSPATSSGRLNINSSNAISAGSKQNIGAFPESVAISPNGNFVATGGNLSNYIRVYNSAMSSLVEDYNAGYQPNPAVVWDSKSEYLVTYPNGYDISLFSWNGSNLLTLEQTISQSTYGYYRTSYPYKMDSIAV